MSRNRRTRRTARTDALKPAGETFRRTYIGIHHNSIDDAVVSIAVKRNIAVKGEAGVDISVVSIVGIGGVGNRIDDMPEVVGPS